MDGIPYYDDELAVAPSMAHIQTILYLGPLLNGVAKAAGQYRSAAIPGLEQQPRSLGAGPSKHHPAITGRAAGITPPISLIKTF
jgi:hypothetical protein